MATRTTHHPCSSLCRSASVPYSIDSLAFTDLYAQTCDCNALGLLSRPHYHLHLQQVQQCV